MIRPTDPTRWWGPFRYHDALCMKRRRAPSWRPDAGFALGSGSSRAKRRHVSVRKLLRTHVLMVRRRDGRLSSRMASLSGVSSGDREDEGVHRRARACSPCPCRARGPTSTRCCKSSAQLTCPGRPTTLAAYATALKKKAWRSVHPRMSSRNERTIHHGHTPGGPLRVEADLREAR